MLDRRWIELTRCGKCVLADTRRNLLVGTGDTPADILVIGECPDKGEDLIGRGLIGETGKLMSRMWDDAGLSRYRSYHTFVTMCRPTDKKGGDSRDPRPEEILMCMGNVMTLVDLLKPRAYVLIGDEAKKYYRKSFPSAVCILSPVFLNKTGGTKSSHYLRTIHALEEICLLLS